ncbi:hypothetical protein DIPPA_02691 [Diplonema papillatum]|nr:hypothetical protein DIPPA_06366 [Diplonema papillatum]KAJ9438901.1 hypothetical protein DIPPA_02691 [Diplonema papillatum]
MVYGQVRKPMGGVDLERRLDELQRRLQSMIELKTGWAEPHQKSRELQRLFRLHDMDATGTMSLAEFSGVLLKFNIGGTDEEVQALFDRFDINENGLLSFQEFGDGLFGLKRNPLADAQCRDVLSRVQTRLLKRTNSSMRGFSRSVRVMDRDRSGTPSPLFFLR